MHGCPRTTSRSPCTGAADTSTCRCCAGPASYYRRCSARPQHHLRRPSVGGDPKVTGFARQIRSQPGIPRSSKCRSSSTPRPHRLAERIHRRSLLSAHLDIRKAQCRQSHLTLCCPPSWGRRPRRPRFFKLCHACSSGEEAARPLKQFLHFVMRCLGEGAGNKVSKAKQSLKIRTETNSEAGNKVSKNRQ